ncbi:MAG: hypothetical protein KGL44_09750, partial [Sphingomonadales bacterium]|nr:hypothetical protein [Sphingomonadales bacterium]
MMGSSAMNVAPRRFDTWVCNAVHLAQAMPDKSTQRSKFEQCSAGNTTLIVAFSLPLFLAALGLGVDQSLAYLNADRLQHAADEAALSAAYAYTANSSSDLNQQAAIIAAKYGFTTANNTTITVNKPP